MKELSDRERELAAIGAAIASNCIPCLKYHIPAAKKAGLSALAILEAVRVAEKVRQVPAREAFQSALALVDENGDGARGENSSCCD